jgi:antitoxin ParD1/3/4
MAKIDKLGQSIQAVPMNVSLTPELEKLVLQKVRSGQYNNNSEVVREALRLMVERDRLQELHVQYLKDALAEGIAQADRGELIDGPTAVSEVRESLRRRRKSRKKGR